VVFTRDGSSRITAIYDPNSLDGSQHHGPPALTYAYDGLGI